ncbi:MAG: hypothetical protein ACJ71P_02825 [Nitrososphaeraceae archaeon]
MPTHRATPKVISTYIRMNYLSQPITGLLLKTSQLFSGRVITLLNFGSKADGSLKYRHVGEP